MCTTRVLKRVSWCHAAPVVHPAPQQTWLTSVALPLEAAAPPSQAPRWRKQQPSPFSTAIPPSRLAAGLELPQPLDEATSDPLITLYSVANDDALLASEFYGAFPCDG